MRKWIFLLLLSLLWGCGVIAAWSTGDYRGQVFMYYREDDAPMQEALAHYGLDPDRGRPGPKP